MILIDARKGVLTQTRRHSYLVSLLGIRKVVLAINKMDLVDYSESTFDEIVDDYRGVRRRRSASTTSCAIPVSGLRGDNITGPERAHALVPRADADGVPRDGRDRGRRPSTVRCACRCSGSTGPNLDFRGFAGTIASGTVRRAIACACCPRAARARSTRIVTMDGDLEHAVAGQSVTLDAGRRDRRQPRRRARASGRPAERRRPVRGDHGLDVATSRCCRVGRTG